MAITTQMRAQIIFLHGQGKSQRQIARELGVCRRTVARWIERVEEGGGIDSAPIPGRPRSSSLEQDVELITLARADPELTVQTVQQLCDFPGSLRTAQQRVLASGLRMMVPRIFELKLQETRIKGLRVSWAGSQREAFFGHRVWIDESTITTDTRHRRRVRALRGRGSELRRFTQTSGRVSISIFGGLTGDELLPLYVVAGKFTAEQFRDVLSELYLPLLQEKFLESDFSF